MHTAAAKLTHRPTSNRERGADQCTGYTVEAFQLNVMPALSTDTVMPSDDVDQHERDIGEAVFQVQTNTSDGGTVFAVDRPRGR